MTAHRTFTRAEFQALYDAAGSYRALGERIGMSWTQAAHIGRQLGIKHRGPGRPKGATSKASRSRDWCAEAGRPCAIVGLGECEACRVQRRVIA